MHKATFVPLLLCLGPHLQAQSGCSTAELLEPPVATGGSGSAGFGAAMVLPSPAQLYVSSPRNPGAIYRFTKSGGTWSFSDQSVVTTFGLVSGDFAVSMDHAGLFTGGLVAGWPNADFAGPASGVAFVYPSGGGTSLQAALLPPDLQAGSNFGRAVAAFQWRYFVGAPTHVGATESGAVFAYQIGGPSAPSTYFQKELRPSDAANGQLFGWSVDAEGDVLCVGAPGDAGETGAVYVFEEVPSSTGASYDAVQVQKLVPAGLAPGSFFGGHLKLHGDRLVVSAPATLATQGVSGSAYVFERQPNGTFVQTAHLDPDLPASVGARRVGARLEHSGDHVVLRGQSQPDLQDPVIYPLVVVFRREAGAWFQAEVVTADDLDFDARLRPGDTDVAVGGDRYYFVAAEDPSGAPRVVERLLPGLATDLGPGLAGNAAPALDADACLVAGTTARARVGGGAPGAPGLLLVGRQAASTPAFGGTLYVGGANPSAWSHVLDAFGETTFEAPLSSATSGVTFVAQAGYVDAGAPQGIALTNGLALEIR